jgi:hypothetical protein
MDPKSLPNIQKNKPNFLEFPFMDLPIEIQKGEDEVHLKSFQVAQIAAFKTENHQYQNESWYKKLIQSLMKYPEFRELWPKVGLEEYHKKLYEYEYKRFEGEYDGKRQTLDFHLFTSRLITDPRFQVVLCVPTNKEAKDFCIIKG